MTQQEFSDYIGLAPATLSSIFNGRTRPTLNVVEALKKKIPNISVDWLMFGSGDMFITPQGEISGTDNIVNNSLNFILFMHSVPKSSIINKSAFNTSL